MGCPLEKSLLSFLEKVFTIIRVYETKSGLFGAPLVDGNAEILERCVIGIEWASIRPKYTDVLRREFQNLPDLCFLFAFFFSRIFALFNFNTGAIPFDDL